MGEDLDGQCVFCRIVRGDFGTTFVAADEHGVAFADLDPKAPVHVLVVPRRHVRGLSDAADGDPALCGALLQLCATVAKQTGILASGYRVLTNQGEDAGQTVFHLHFHVMGGGPLKAGLG